MTKKKKNIGTNYVDYSDINGMSEYNSAISSFKTTEEYANVKKKFVFKPSMSKKRRLAKWIYDLIVLGLVLFSFLLGRFWSF